jgi:hypothetical protein
MMKICMSFDIGTVNLGFAAAKVNSNGEGEIFRAEIVNIKASSTDACVLKLWRHLDEVMEEIEDGMEINVYIEQQPSKARSVMRSVELGVRYFFLRQSMFRKKINIKSVSSRTKLAEAVIYPPGATTSQKYRARKKASVVEIGKMMVGGAPLTWDRISSTKADDVCDALLYIARHGKVDRFIDPVKVGDCDMLLDLPSGISSE